MPPRHVKQGARAAAARGAVSGAQRLASHSLHRGPEGGQRGRDRGRDPSPSCGMSRHWVGDARKVRDADVMATYSMGQGVVSRASNSFCVTPHELRAFRWVPREVTYGL